MPYEINDHVLLICHNEWNIPTIISIKKKNSNVFENACASTIYYYIFNYHLKKIHYV